MSARKRPVADWGPQHWRRLRQVVQYVALFAFVALFVWSRRGGWSGMVVNVPMRVDPLAMLAHLLASHRLLSGSALALLTVGLTLALGRVWCGWLCPLGTLLDVFSPRHRRDRKDVPPESWRSAKYGLLLIILAAALLGNLTLLILDPLTILFRTLSASVWPAVDQVFSASQAFLYRLPALRPGISAFDALIRPKILPPEPAFYRYTWLYAGTLAGIVSLNLLAPRFWCRYLCPLGGLLGLLSKASLVRRRVNTRCIQCDACARVCPTGTIQPQQQYASDSGECSVCLECLYVCPHGAVEFAPHFSIAAWNSYDPSRRQALLALGTAIAGVGLFRSDLSATREHPRLIRPPGARENGLLSKCIRCGECSRACPTSAIQPAIAEAGLEGLWTPVVVPRLGYCDYSCAACGQVCPVQAIPPLDLQQKRQQVLGEAYINQTRCLPWANNQPCIVCEEMCPVPHKAIELEKVEVLDPNGEMITLQRPHVIRSRCIGCGTCEFKCPVNGEAAIRVYVPQNGRLG